jgi:hypothetical protein
MAPSPRARTSVFDSGVVRHLRGELLAMTPGTDQFADRLRAIMVELDADQARLEHAVENTDTTRFGRSASRGRTAGTGDA